MFTFIRDSKNRHFMRLWSAQLISQFGDRVHQMALIGLIAEFAPGSALGLAKLLAFTIIPVFIVGPVAGVLVDRWDNRRTMFICDLIRGGLVLLIPLVFMKGHFMPPIYMVVFLIFCFSRFHVPAKMSLIPDLVAKEKLLVANSLMTTTGMIAFVLGASLGGFLVDRLGARDGFLIDAWTFFLSALFVISIKKDFSIKIHRTDIVHAGQDIIRAERSLWHEMVEGLKYLIGHREIRFVIGVLFVLLAAAGSVYVVIIVFIQQEFASITKDLGILAIFLGGGLFSGALLYGKWGQRIAWHKTIFGCLILGGAMIMSFAWIVGHFSDLIMAGVLAAGLGLVLGPIFIASNTIVHIVSDEVMRGKVFSALEIVIHLAFLAAMLASSWLSEFTPSGHILIGVGIICMAVGFFGMVTYKIPPALAKAGGEVA